MRILTFTVTERWDNRTLEKFLREGEGFSSRGLAQMKKIPDGMLRNGEPVRSVDIIHTGDQLRLVLPETETVSPLMPSSIPVDIVYQDEDLVVFDKPAGMPCHPSRRYQQDTLANVYAALEQGREENVVFRPVNRLDRNTTGLVLAARNSYTASRLGGQGNDPGHERGRQLEKRYLALVEGRLSPKRGKIEAPIGRLNQQSTIRLVAPDGQYALTWYQVLRESPLASLVQVRLGTGRTHQIRVHFSYLGHPLVGDDLYGGAQEYASTQMLRCYYLSFLHPVSGERITLSRPYDPPFWEAAGRLGIFLPTEHVEDIIPDDFLIDGTDNAVPPPCPSF